MTRLRVRLFTSDTLSVKGCILLGRVAAIVRDSCLLVPTD